MKNLLLSTVLLATTCVPAMAQRTAPCAPRDQVIIGLAERWGESRQALGIIQGEAIMEIFASEETGTFTVIITSGNGMSCLVASGDNYEVVSETLPPAGEDG